MRIKRLFLNSPHLTKLKAWLIALSMKPKSAGIYKSTIIGQPRITQSIANILTDRTMDQMEF